MKKDAPVPKEKSGYLFDNIMSKGTIALVVLLFMITAAVVVITGILGSWLNKDLSASMMASIPSCPN